VLYLVLFNSRIICAVNCLSAIKIFLNFVLSLKSIRFLKFSSFSCEMTRQTERILHQTASNTIKPRNSKPCKAETFTSKHRRQIMVWSKTYQSVSVVKWHWNAIPSLYNVKRNVLKNELSEISFFSLGSGQHSIRAQTGAWPRKIGCKTQLNACYATVSLVLW